MFNTTAIPEKPVRGTKPCKLHIHRRTILQNCYDYSVPGTISHPGKAGSGTKPCNLHINRRIIIQNWYDYSVAGTIFAFAENVRIP